MGVGYHIRLGYNGRTDWHSDDAWKELKNFALKLAKQPEVIAEEAKKFNAPENCCDECETTLIDVCKTYDKSYGNPLTIIDKLDNEGDPDKQVMQMATGGCLLKDHTRRAFCRLIINEMHKQGIEVSLTVC